MGSLTLQPEMKDESAELQLDDNFLSQLRDKYSCRVKVSLYHEKPAGVFCHFYTQAGQ